MSNISTENAVSPEAKQTNKRARREAIENLSERYEAARTAIGVEGLRTIHLRPSIWAVDPSGESIYGMRSQCGGMTVVYRQRPQDSFIEVATAVCSHRDVYARHVGTALAVEAFLAQKRIRIPNYHGGSADEIVDKMFRGHMEQEVDFGEFFKLFG